MICFNINLRAFILNDSLNRLKSNYTNRKNEFSAFDEKKFDEVFVGEKNTDKSFPISSNNKFHSYQKVQFTELSTIDINKIIDSFRSKLIYFSIYPFVLGVFLFLISAYNSDKLNVVHLSSASFISVSIYFLLLCIAIPFYFGKRKLKLQIKNNYLYLKSFPAFLQSIPIPNIESCMVNTIGTDDAGSGNYEIFRQDNYHRVIKVNLESGVSILLKNGKNILIGSSNSLPSDFSTINS